MCNKNGTNPFFFVSFDKQFPFEYNNYSKKPAGTTGNGGREADLRGPFSGQTMEPNTVFNATVCLIGVLILSVHLISVAVKKDKRKDEKYLFYFFLFTIIHFAAYLVFTFIKPVYTDDTFVIAFYTSFYIMNNIEVLLLYRYMSSYVDVPERTDAVISAVNVSLFLIYFLLDIANIFTGLFFTSVDGVYTRSPHMILSQGYQFIMFIIIAAVALSNRKLHVREKIAFSVYCGLPFVGIVFQNIFRGYAIAYASIIIAIEGLFVFLNIEKSIRLSKQEQENKESQIRIMISPIQPHFIYNSLSSISTMILIDPEKAQTALDHFTEYLRHNLQSLTEHDLIPFRNELQHIKTYVELEKLRFEDRIRVVYDTQALDFRIPPLSIQPLVENSIKHGILKKLEGGTVTVRSYETARAYVVEISDDGIGFDPGTVGKQDSSHVGLNNIGFRIRKMCDGDMRIESAPDRGTHVTVTFSKEGIES